MHVHNHDVMDSKSDIYIYIYIWALRNSLINCGTENSEPRVKGSWATAKLALGLGHIYSHIQYQYLMPVTNIFDTIAK